NVQAITHSIAAEILQLHSRTIYAVVGTGEVIGRSATGESYEQIYDFVPAPDIDGIRALIAIIPAQLRQQVRMLCSELDGYF
ncbi:MAG: hypothetical protein KIT87_09360, partial [Anaerolineae bacterium]|nr:hypothetical protein [Anaerolineae bacterium]